MLDVILRNLDSFFYYLLWSVLVYLHRNFLYILILKGKVKSDK